MKWALLIAPILLILFVITYIIYYFKVLINILNKRIQSLIPLYIYCGFCFILVAFSLPNYFTYSVKSMRQSKSYEIVMENSKIRTGEAINYVGKTLNYTFLYDKQHKTTHVIPNENILQMNVVLTKTAFPLEHSSDSIRVKESVKYFQEFNNIR